MINLTKAETKWIKFCKFHYEKQYPWKGSWVESMKPLFTEIYGWNPDEDNNYHDYLDCIFNKLFEIQLKISDDKSGSNYQIKSIFKSAFYKSPGRQNELPIERAICELCGMIQNNQVIESDGLIRYDLETYTENIPNPESRFLVVFEEKFEYLYMETPWNNDDINSIGKWKIISEHSSKEEAKAECKKLNGK